MATKKSEPTLKKRGSYHHGNLREALLSAAVRRIAQSQDFDFRLRDLAEDCGVRLAACYRHFAAKHDVLVELARRGFLGLAEALASVARAREPAQVLAELGAAYIGFALANPVSYLAMFHPSLAQRAQYPELDASARRALEPLQSAVAGVLGRKSVDSPQVAAAVFQAWANVHGYASLLVSQAPEGAPALFGRPGAPRAIRAFTEAFVRSLSAASAGK